MNGQASRRRVEEFARLADLAVDRPGAEVARQLALDEDGARLVAVTRALRELRLDAQAEPEFRDRLRRRLVAVASVNPPAAAPAPRHPLVRAPGARSPRLAFLAGALAALMLVTGLTLLASSRALPGDTLYAVKRSSEHLELALVHDPQERGLRQLSFAQTRLEEIGQLIARGGGVSLGAHTRTVASGHALTAGDVDLVRQALDDMDRDTVQGASLVTTYAVSRRSDQSLATLATWAVAQRSTLTGMQGRLPAATADRAATSVALLDRLSTRVAQLRGALPCTCLAKTGHDELGPLPCSPCAPAQPGGGALPSSRGPAGTQTGGPTPARGPAASPTASPTPTATTPTTAGPLPTTTLPSAPSITSTTPVLCDLLGPIVC